MKKYILFLALSFSLFSANAAIIVTPSTCPNGITGHDYSVSFTATGGTSPYQFTISAGTLPAGLNLGLQNGVLNGVPTASVSTVYTFTVRARDAVSATGTRSYTVTVAPNLITTQNAISLWGNRQVPNFAGDNDTWYSVWNKITDGIPIITLPATTVTVAVSPLIITGHSISLNGNTSLWTGGNDAFARPQQWFYPTNSIVRLGSWTQDGDATTVPSEGGVWYGLNAVGVQSNTEGGYARIKSNRFGLAQKITGVNGGNLFYYFNADATSLFLANDLNNKKFEIIRSNGNGYTLGDFGVGINTNTAKFEVLGTGTTSVTFSQKNYANDNSTLTFGVRDDGYIQAGITDASLTVGKGSGFTSVGNTHNTIFGSLCAANMTSSAQENTISGYGAALKLTSGGGNTIFGSDALRNLTTAGGATAVGYQALYTATGGSNTAIGRQAFFNMGAGTNGVALGAYAGLNETESYAFYVNTIGYNGATIAADRTASIMWGLGHPTPSSQILNLNAKVGINLGATLPTHQFEVSGTQKVTGQISYTGLSTYVNNAAALAGGLIAGDLYLVVDAVTGSKIIEVVQ